MLRDLLVATPPLALIVGGVGLVVLVGRDRSDANEHDVSDYRPPVDEPVPAVRGRVPAAWPIIDRKPMPARRAARRRRQELVESIVPTLSDAAVRGIADEWLRELGDEARARLELAR